jgi:hypothetical protein
MPSSISSSKAMDSEARSSESRRWLLAWLLGIALTIFVLIYWEMRWRAQGLHPGLIDSQQLWSMQRDRIYEEKLRSVLFLGASRTVYGLDPKRWKAQRAQDKPLMLAVNGHYPVAALQDLAADQEFRGLVIVDIDSYGLLAAHHAMQQPWIDYYHRRWNHNWRVHRLLLNAWQQWSVLSNPGIGLWPALKRAWSGSRFVLPYSESRSDRSGWMRFDRTDVAALAAHFDRDVEPKMARFPAPSPSDFLTQTEPVRRAAAAIRARGGEVVFVMLPVRGRLVEMETHYMPRSDYWEAFAALPDIRALHYEEVPEWHALELPDRSHVTPDARATLTDGLIAALRRRGWLETESRASR